MSAMRSGRDIVIEISGSVVEKLLLHHVRMTQDLSCVDLGGPGEVLLGLPPEFADEHLSHIGLWPISVSLSENDSAAMVSLTLAVPRRLTPDGSGVKTVSIALEPLLSLLEASGNPLLPTDLPIFALLGVRVKGKPAIRVVTGGALAIGFDVDLGGVAPTADWDSYTDNFLGERDWALAIDAAVLTAFIHRKLEEEVNRSKHSGGTGGASWASLTELAGVGDRWHLEVLSEHPEQNRPIRDEHHKITGWTPAWDLVVPGYFGGTGRHHDLFFYRRADGHSRMYSTDGSGNLEVLHEQSLQSGWDLIVPGEFARGQGAGPHTALLAYRRDSGRAAFYTRNAGGGLSVANNLQLDLGYTLIVAGPFGAGIEGRRGTGFLTFDHKLQRSQVYTTDGLGNQVKLAERTWDVAWDHILAVQVGPGPSLLFATNDGQAELHLVDGQGELTLIRAFNLGRGWDTLVAGKFGGPTRTDLLLYNSLYPPRAGFYALHDDGQLRELSTHTDWRIGWELLVPAQIANTGHTGLVLYDTSVDNPKITWEYLKGYWHNRIHVHGRGEYHDPDCGGIDFEIDIYVRFKIDLGGALTLDIKASDPQTDFWDGAQAALCKGFNVVGILGLAIGVVLTITGWVSLVVDQIIAHFFNLDVDQLTGALLGDSPKVVFAVGDGSFVGEYIAQNDHGLVIFGRCDLGELPLPGRLDFSLPGAGPGIDFYLTAQRACSGLGQSFTEQKSRLANRGPGILQLCEIDFSGDPGFYIASARFPWGTVSPPAIGVSSDGRSLTGLPVRYQPGWPEFELSLGYRGSVDADANGTLRIVSNFPDQPLLEVSLRAIAGGHPTRDYEPKDLIEITASNTEAGVAGHLVQDCRLIEDGYVRERAAGSLVVENTGDRPLYICSAWLESLTPEVFGLDISTRLVKPSESTEIFIYFFPRVVMRDYEATIKVRTSAAPAGTFPDIEVPVHARLEAQAGEQTGPIGPDGAALGYIHDVGADQLCVPPNADFSRTRQLFEPVASGLIQVSVLAFYPVPAAAEVHLRDPDGNVLVRDFSGERQRQMAIGVSPGDDEGGSVGNPCIAGYTGISASGFEQLRISMSGKLLRRSASFHGAPDAAAVAATGDWAFIAGSKGIHSVRWLGHDEPVRSALFEFPGASSLALFGNRLLAVAGRVIVLLDITDPAKLSVLSSLETKDAILALAAARDSAYAVDGEYLLVLTVEAGKLHLLGSQIVEGGARELGLLPGGTYVRGAQTLALFSVAERAKVSKLDEIGFERPAELSHYGRSIMLTGDQHGTEVFSSAGQRLRRIASYQRPHWSRGFVPDQEHRRLYRLTGAIVERWEINVHRLDRVHFADDFRFRYQPAEHVSLALHRPVRTSRILDDEAKRTLH